MKKILILLLAFILPAVAVAYDAKIDGIYYNFNKDAKTATVTYYWSGSSSHNAYSGTVNIPPTVDYGGETYDVTSIGDYAFHYCSGLTSVTIPGSVTNIGESAFRDCSGLTSVTIPGSVTSIGGGAFIGTGWYNNQPDGILYLDNWLIGVKGEKPTGKLVIHEGTRGLAAVAFSGCSGLTSVTIPGSVTSIGGWAFSGCRGLTSVTIPGSVTSIGIYAFYGCRGLTSVTIPGSVTSIGGLAFYGCSGLTSVTISGSVTSIGDYAFSGCSGLTSVTISDGVTSIGDWAFRNCSGLTSVTIPDGITTINERTFEGCSSMESLKLPETLTIIRNSAFKGCRALKSVTIPATVEFIYQEAFANCWGLESVKALPETPPFLYESSFSNYDIPLYAPKTAIAAYQAKEPWSKFAQFLTLDGQEVEMPQCATPTIDYANWKLTFSCETKDAEIVTKAVCSDSQEGDGGPISLMPTYTITAYARAEGYRDSDVATATIGWKNGRPVVIRGFSNVSLSDHNPNCDTNMDGNIDVADIATIIDAMADKSREESY